MKNTERQREKVRHADETRKTAPEPGFHYFPSPDVPRGDEGDSVLTFKSDKPGASVAGRLCFIQAVSFYCPGFFENLRDDVLNSPDRYFLMLAAAEDIPPESRVRAQANFDKWLWDWNLQDEWLVDTCRHTLQAWAVQVLRDGAAAIENVHPLPVFYGPNDQVLDAALREFKPIFDSPFMLAKKMLQVEDRRALDDAPPTSRRIYEAMVERESAAEFKKRIRAQFEHQLSKYADDRQKQILPEVGNQRRDAEWTALFHFGMTPKRIEAWEHKRSGTTLTQTRIQQAIKSFAGNIGLSLRPPKAGRAAKRASAIAAI